MRIAPSAVSSSEATDASLTSPDPVKPAPCQARASPTPVAIRSRPVRSGEPGTIPDPTTLGRAPRRSRPQALELARLGGALEDLLAGHAVAQDLAGRRRVARAVDVAPPDLERAEPSVVGDPVEVGLGRELGLRRPEPAERAVRAACSSASRGPGCGRSGSGTARRRGWRRATGRPASACSTRRRPSRPRCPGRSAGRRG